MDERSCFEVLLESIKESLIIKFMRKITDEINDTHMEELQLHWKIHWNTRLAASDVLIINDTVN